jgi:hypothetical protein
LLLLLLVRRDDAQIAAHDFADLAEAKFALRFD